MSNGAQQASRGATYRMLHELGSRAQHSYAAIRDPHELVVAQRFVRVRTAADRASASAESATPLDVEAMAILLRDARCLAKNWHPNIGRVRHVDLSSAGGTRCTELTIASELLDGTTLEDLIEAAQHERTSPRDPLLAVPVLVRVLLDVLAGLHALHALRDGMNMPLGAIHGELCPANVIIGKDGVARIVNVLRKRPVQVERGSEAVPYAAPESLDAGGTGDPRSDVYAVGVMLWEGLAGRWLYDESLPARVLSRQREGELTAPSIHPSSPFARLSDVAMRALSFDPGLRYRGPAEMAAELRKIAGARLASGSAVAKRVADLAGDRIRMRRAILEPAVSGTRRRVSERAIAAAKAALEERESEPLAREASSTFQANDDLLGPRGSSPQLDLEAAIALSQSDRARADNDVSASKQSANMASRAPTVSPVTPNIPFPRAVVTPSTHSLPATGTPGDFVIPIDVPETLDEAAPRRRRHFAAIALVAALALVTVGAFVVLRPAARLGGAPSTAVATTPAARAAATAPQAAAPSATDATTNATNATTNATPAAAAPRPAPHTPPPAKPKKSTYGPDGF